ncbi:D-alanine--D-alanine ligase [Pedobacter sp. HMF7647]|uniref:D-alanine--D-alanine ligase n=1 Tax=Hufsiella arboris TaxID=2695275 RepID=A0A7K1Y7A1_9SPHI|nr:D-alanine--D-alanine ligase [Hufsiella arboris]MXV50446.1 D-alanine--D-alanine ligase [Hufsiella arboris]
MKKRIALVTGGFTGESVVSFKSADFVMSKIDPARYDVYKVIITIEDWYVEIGQQKVPVDKNDFSIAVDNEIIKFDVAFIILHGAPGEDGKLQGYFDMIGLPYTSCNALTSALTMNKGYTKAVVDGLRNLHIARSVQLFAGQKNAEDLITSNLQLPYFVKPNNGGSSIGMSKVKEISELAESLEKAFNEDSQILVEEFIDGREFSVGVYRDEEGVKVLPATEVISPKEFFDFEAKYTPGMTEEITPGRMNEEERSRVEQVVTDVYVKLNCQGMVRIDYFLEKATDKFYFIEINTIPGQTETSFIPQQVKAAGMNISNFYENLIQTAVCRH